MFQFRLFKPVIIIDLQILLIKLLYQYLNEARLTFVHQQFTRMIGVIIIEDAVEYRTVLKMLFNETPGFKCLADYSNAEACLNEKLYAIADVALVDIRLPGMSGVELIRKLRRQNENLLFLICSAFEENDQIFNALEAGAHGYLLKCSSPEFILNSVRDLAGGGSPMSSGIARKVVKAFQSKPVEEFGLTNREVEVLEQLSNGLLYKEIALKLNISIDTIKRHCFNIYEKLDVQNRTEALRKYNGRSLLKSLKN